MQASGVDPRNINRELEPDVYRVYFHDSDGASDEWRLTNVASVVECLKWAEAHAADRTYVLYVEIPQPDSETLLARLAGKDPNEWEPPLSPLTAAQKWVRARRRMRMRRHQR